MIVATNGTEEYPVKVVHWWPGREFRNRNMTAFFNMVAWGRGLRYITAAHVSVGPLLLRHGPMLPERCPEPQAWARDCPGAAEERT